MQMMMQKWAVLRFILPLAVTLTACGDDDTGNINGNTNPGNCGNGALDGNEVCDDGNVVDGDGCSADCLSDESCGNGIVDSSVGEICDNGEQNSDTVADACRTSCVPPSCGDGVMDSSEECDDGASNSDTTADACRTSCVSAICGDGVVDSSEECDDGVLNSDTAADACRTSCVSAICGDGVVDSSEECDDGASNSDTAADACRTSCLQASCGDEVVDSSEACDDGNQLGGDNCLPDCSAECDDCCQTCFTQDTLGCGNFDLATCEDECRATRDAVSWCAVESLAFVACLVGEPATSFECYSGGVRPLGSVCNAEAADFQQCWFDGPAGGLPDLSAECSTFCSHTTGLPCVSNCVTMCNNIVANGPCAGAFGAWVECAVGDPSAVYQCNAQSVLEVVSAACDLHQDMYGLCLASP